MVRLAFVTSAGLLMLSACASPSIRPALEVRRDALGSFSLRPGEPSNATAARVTLPPSLRSGAHRHPGAVIAYIISGKVTVQIRGAPARDYRAGEAVLEPAGQVIERFDNASSIHPATFLAIYLTGEDPGPLVQPTR